MTTAATNMNIARPKRSIPNSVLGMILFVITETMFFTALISAYVVIKAGYGYWAPPAGLTFPVAITGANTVVLIMSGFLLVRAGYCSRRDENKKALQLMMGSLLLGALFVGVQGYEWIGLIKFGFTLKSSVFSSTFFLLVGSHALHAFTALAFLGFYCYDFYKNGIDKDLLTALQVLWLFVVGVWPILYGVVYF